MNFGPGGKDETRDGTVVIGAGIGGLVCALLVAASGRPVTVLERGAAPGGKMREVAIGEARVDSGPTVLTLRGVFDAIFEAAGASLDERLPLRQAQVLARHAWDAEGPPERARLDLFADVERSADAIGDFAGAREARGFRDFCRASEEVFRMLDEPFIRAEEPSLPRLMASQGMFGAHKLMAIRPFTNLMPALAGFFRDERLAQLFGRYATYTGSSPYLAPATLMLIAHVEQAGVWLVEGGMQRLAQALHALAVERGALFRFGCTAREVLVEGGRVVGVVTGEGERIHAARVVANADSGAIAAGILGREAARAVPAMAASQRSLSALTLSLHAPTRGFPLARHSVFFSRNYPAEFEAILDRGRLPGEPTVYVCAQDRDDAGARIDGAAEDAPERLFMIVNAPATGDVRPFSEEEIATCETATFRHLSRLGLSVERRPEALRITTPSDFERMFPGTGGALYGRASHGWNASFERPSVRTRLAGFYLCGGSVHPGAGVPMAALSGWTAAHLISRDSDSTARSRTTGIAGGTSTS
ncbi:1-hydroxycarotenoid 3,4-desaturase CrtD [Salinarimonas ramus]|uniref:Phytoene desaturase n=1 Tax=Salinarimonas ramus TaxID=690164 RepID=A0A917V7I1_9HYPH|nr:1-hydroxycarotenoid 3,4-desaturase CrtD [Salinarimonas ramus]GGK46615.1 phytoene desaturase [Salinarimonas ramus]